MKKFFVLLSISYLFAVLFSGCATNVFSSMDTASKEDAALMTKQDAVDALNSGDYSKAISKIDEVLSADFQGITLSSQLEADPNKKAVYMNLMSMKGEAILGHAGVETLKIVKVFSEISDKVSNPDSTVKITDILGTIDINSITSASAAFAAALPDSNKLTASERAEFKSSYQSAAIAYGLTAAKNLQTISDAFALKDPQLAQTTAQNAWNNSKVAIVDNLAKTVDSLTVAYTNTSTSQGAIAIGADGIASIKNKINDTTSITKELFDSILKGI